MIGCFYLDIFIFQKFYQFCSSFNLAKSENVRQPKCTTEKEEVWGKRTFQNCGFYRSGDVLFADMEVFNGQGNDTERY